MRVQTHCPHVLDSKILEGGKEKCGWVGDLQILECEVFYWEWGRNCPWCEGRLTQENKVIE